jgi:hypothetical protein
MFKQSPQYIPMDSILERGGRGGPAEERWIPWNGDSSKDTHIIRTLESKALSIAKEEITMYYEQGQWDDYKKITNPYEYIFLSWNRRTSRSVATRSPLSRSYFKMIEFWKYANITKELSTLVTCEGGLKTAHSAEGPGGFLEAIAVMADRIKWNYLECHAITLKSTTKHVPGWRKAATFLETHPTVYISYGKDDTGNILHKENRTYFLEECKKVHLYTADGGFDFSSDYSAQEDSIFSLLVAEILIGIQSLQKGGIMIIKCFDTTEKQTLDLLWMTCSLFREWNFMKPRTSRAGNAERYFIGKGFLGEEAGVKEMVELLEAAKQEKGVPLLKNSYPKEWIQTMWEIQEAIEKEEYRIIRDTIALIREEHSNSSNLRSLIRSLIRQNVIRSMEWCKEHCESISTEWETYLDRYVAQEVIDLFQILKPTLSLPPTHRIPSWTVRSERVPTERMFEGFRQPVSSVLTVEEIPTETPPPDPLPIITSFQAADRSGGAASVSSSLISPPALREGNVPTAASQTDPPERFPRAPRRYVDLFSRPRRTPTVEASSLADLLDTI